MIANSFFNTQLSLAKENLNYFFMTVVTKVLMFIFKLSLCLIINGIFDYFIINIICLLYTIYSMINIYKMVTNYSEIIKDIKSIIKVDKLYFEFDFNLIKNGLFRKKENYGK